MGRADLHIHTSAGDGLDALDAVLDHAERSGALDVIAVTEHDDLRPGLVARETAARRGMRTQAVAGVEVTTLQGHLVALFLEQPIASLRPIEETIEAVRAQNGLCFVPHPANWLTRSVGPSTLDRLQAAGLLPEALELAGGGAAARLFMPRVRCFNAERYRLPGVGASDAHHIEAIGSAYTEFEGSTAEDLRQALVSGAIVGVDGRAATVSPMRRLRVVALPITGLRATPRRLGWRRTAWSFVSRYGA